jgi:hypothetical protein
MFTDEAVFTSDGIIIFRSSHVRTDENLDVTFQSKHQCRFSKISLVDWHTWAETDRPLRLAVRVDRLLLSQLRNQLLELLEDVPLGRRAQMCFMHDEALPHFTVAVREHFHVSCSERWA